MQKGYKSILLSIVLSFLFLLQQGFSQDANFDFDYDSLTRQLPLKKSVEEKIKLLVLLVDRYQEFATQPDDIVVGYLDQLIELNKQNHVINGLPYETMHKAFLQWRAGDLENALISMKSTI